MVNVSELSEHGFYLNLIHDSGKLLICSVEAVDRAHGDVKVLDVLGVHDEKGCVAGHDVTDPTLGRILRPVGYPLLKLKKGVNGFLRKTQ